MFEVDLKEFYIIIQSIWNEKLVCYFVITKSLICENIQYSFQIDNI